MQQLAAQIVQQVVAQFPWGQNVVLMDKIADSHARLWYAEKTRQEGWSRNILLTQIEAKLHEREGRAVTNFPRTLPPADSDMATQVFKDPEDLMRHPDDAPPIGLLLCKGKDRTVVEYVLRGFEKPMGVTQWETMLVDSLSDDLKGSLPTIEEIEAELSGWENGE